MYAATSYFQAQTRWFLRTSTWSHSHGFVCSRENHFTPAFQKLSGLLIISNNDLGFENGEGEKVMFDLVTFKTVNGSFSIMGLGCSPPL